MMKEDGTFDSQTDDDLTSSSSSSLTGENGVKRTFKAILPSPSESLSKYYQITEDELGIGYFAVVYVGIQIDTGERVAIKRVSKRMVEKDESLEREVMILSAIDNPYVVKMKGIFDTSEFLYIVMELMEGGELFEEISRRKSFTEFDASYIMKQVFLALSYLHANKIVHRDLKLENLLLVRHNALDIKVADFGLSTVYAKRPLFTACGTPFYVAPEIVLGEGYDFQIDLWASGVILYILLSGKLPYAAEREPDLYQLIIDNNLVFKSPQFDSVSDIAKDLIRKLIVSNPEDRLTASQALGHPFITGDIDSITQLHHTYLDNIKEHSTLMKTDIMKYEFERSKSFN